jgi:hypothetical protein
VFKKEHLALDEVAGILRRINEEKREADRYGGRREHEFFVPNGSKILVGSYVHLRREGLQGYVEDFNNMVGEVQRVTGDTGIEVLSVVPVCFEGLDPVGRELLGGLKMRVEWMGEKTGRKEIRELAMTAGSEKVGSKGTTLIWRPTCVLLKSKGGGDMEIGNKGNHLKTLAGEREEWLIEGIQPAREVRKMLRLKGGEANEEEAKARETFVNGISVEGEFAL